MIPNIKEAKKFPLIGYAGYGITKFFNSFKSLSLLLSKIETLHLKRDIAKIEIDRPIYITGLARAGTTIILEMLEKHPDLATHNYKNLLLPYLPYWFSKITDKTHFYSEPFERLHSDGIIVTRDSPEAVEEIFWQRFFSNSHNEEITNINSRYDSNPKFESFYYKHIKKLLSYQKCPRYLAKNNYIFTRLDYLLNIIPSSRVLLIIRDPVDQIASLIKQTELYLKLGDRFPLLPDWLEMLGHYEFGRNQLCINMGNTEIIHNIRNYWKKKSSYVKGWALYWSSIYDFIANQLKTNRKIAKASLVVRYDDLCENPERIIDRILNHTELPVKSFEIAKNYYIKNLHKPTYYSPKFSKEEINDIRNITGKTAAKFGY